MNGKGGFRPMRKERAMNADDIYTRVPTDMEDWLARLDLRMTIGGRDAPAGATGTVRSEEHTSELQSLMRISYAVFCLKKKTKTIKQVHLKQHKNRDRTTIKHIKTMKES